MSDEPRVTRRSALKTAGILGAASLASSLGESTAGSAAEPPPQASDTRRQVFARVWATPLVDTHEHLVEERDRLEMRGRSTMADDWSLPLNHYLDSDLLVAGMPPEQHKRFFGPGLAPQEKWRLLEPFWPAVKNTGYGQAVAIAFRELYGVSTLSAGTIEKVQAGYEALRKPGFYRHVLGEVCNIESCQVNSLTAPFNESAMPTFLMQDLSIVGFFVGPSLKSRAEPTGIQVKKLSDWHAVIDWWFAKYGRYAVAVKSQNAYQRDIDYARVPAGEVEGFFGKRVGGQKLAPDEQKALENHLFWYAVQKATEARLPVKLHTGYYAGANSMPLERLRHNAGSACELCRLAPETSFVFMHINYPNYEELIAVAKHYTNAHVDMCWAWIINPIAAKDFLKKYLLTAPANKVLTFGGDYRWVEPVVGHAWIARQGIALALSELVEEGWLSLDSALELVDPLMRGNARRIFRLEEKTKILAGVPWARR